MLSDFHQAMNILCVGTPTSSRETSRRSVLKISVLSCFEKKNDMQSYTYPPNKEQTQQKITREDLARYFAFWNKPVLAFYICV